MDQVEETYFLVYTEISEQGEYLQSRGSVRHSLPDVWVVAALASVLTTLLNAYLARFGELASDATISGIRRLSKRRQSSPAATEPTAEETIEAMRLLLPLVQQVEEADQNARLAEVPSDVRDELERLGFPDDVAAELALRIVALIRQRWS